MTNEKRKRTSKEHSIMLSNFEMIKHMYLTEGKTCKQIGDFFGFHAGTVRTFLRKMEIFQGDKLREKKANAPDGMKYCAKCDTHKPIEEFYKHVSHDKGTEKGRAWICRDCMKIHAKELRIKNKLEKLRNMTKEEQQEFEEKEQILIKKRLAIKEYMEKNFKDGMKDFCKNCQEFKTVDDYKYSCHYLKNEQKFRVIRRCKKCASKESKRIYQKKQMNRI